MKFIPRQTTVHFKGEFKLILQVILSGRWKHGDALLELEQKFAKYIGCKYAVLVPSVTFGMYRVISTLVDKGSEVICPAFSHFSIPSAVLAAGAKPVFIDVDYQTFNIDVGQIERKLTNRTKAIIVLHFGGQVADLEPILDIARERGLFVISDCAHACGAEYKGKKVGSIEDAACFSFGTGKNMDGFGGGIVTTNNELVAQKVREAVEALCRWPSLGEVIIKIARGYIQWLLMQPLFFCCFTFPLIWLSIVIDRESDILHKIADAGNKKMSCNLSVKDRVRFSNLQAKVVLSHLKFLDNMNEKNRANAFLLTKKLSNINNVKLPLQLLDIKSAFLLYPVKAQDKWNLSFELLKRGIDTRKKYFGACCANLPMFKKFNVHCPNAEKLIREQLYLPVYATLDKDTMVRIADCVRIISSRD